MDSASRARCSPPSPIGSGTIAATAWIRPSSGRSDGRRRFRSATGCVRPSNGTARMNGGGGRSRNRIRHSRRTTGPSTKHAANVSILVTGAAGFAGSYVVQALAGRGEVVGWTHRADPPDEIVPLAAWQRVDLLNPAAVRVAIARVKPSAVIH